jgi:ribosomal protein S18 acetylase RimI-like enzyme
MNTPLQPPPPEIIPFTSAYRSDFRRLNHEWITRYFELEERDNQILDNPESYILAKGGQIFLARYQQEIVGTCALLKVTDTCYELGKMAVTETRQGLKIGQHLCRAALAAARLLGATKLELYSHHSLLPALHLYRKFNFREVPCLPGDYQRSDIKMELELN